MGKLKGFKIFFIDNLRIVKNYYKWFKIQLFAYLLPLHLISWLYLYLWYAELTYYT